MVTVGCMRHSAVRNCWHDSRASQRFELTDSTYYCASSGGLHGVSWTFRTYRCLILQSMHIPSDLCKAGFGECQTQMQLSGYIQCLPCVDLLVLLIVIFIAVVKHVAPAFQSSLCLPQKEFLPDVSDLMNVMLMHTNRTPFVFWRPRNVNGQMCTQKTHAQRKITFWVSVVVPHTPRIYPSHTIN